MAKTKTVYICNQCGYESPRWVGKCPDCGAWNSMEKHTSSPLEKNRVSFERTGNTPVLLSRVEYREMPRIVSHIGEFDRVLGGGLFPASVVLLAGEPGIGKSTLLLQVAASLIQHQNRVLYVSGEESLQQLHNRALRLEVPTRELPVLMETNLENILFQIEQQAPDVVIVDSIQSLYSEDVAGAPGNVAQLRECASRLFRAAKEQGWSLILVGHITKEGSIAGPKILEHMVDVVLSFEGDNLYQYRILRSVKNRFGATNELGIFLMEREGLRQVENPSRLFLSHSEKPQVGVSVVSSFEGSRPILAEVQTLVSRSNYGVPQRTVSGFDPRRLALLLAILEKHGNLRFGVSDVFVKIAGGLRFDDPGIDLGIAMALYSSYQEVALPPNSVFIGEIGLNGDVRMVNQMEARIREAVKLGFRTIYLPKLVEKSLPDSLKQGSLHIAVENIVELFEGKLFAGFGNSRTPSPREIS